MSRTIDERVVEMQFDNRNFERNVKTSMSTIDKLKQSLNFTGATKGLENIESASKKVNMNGISSAVETVQAKFSAMQVVAVTALANITNSAINAGKNIVSALTIDPIKMGFQEYETQMNAVQTILANTESKGSTLTDVNKALNELNKYADQTIYNFTEMTRNIGTFTAAGVDLDKSVTSIKGIANLAAVSGSNAQQASTAMYQLSQALAAGKVSLMDWNSVVNAGMGGQVFQDALKRTAKNFGYNVDAMIAKYGSFRESLTEGGWLTAEVLTETLTQLSGAYTEADLIAQGYSEEQAKQITQLAETAVNAATKVKTFSQLWDTLKESAQSGWTQTWEILIGDFEEAKEFLTELSNTFGTIIQNFSDARNALLYDAMTSNWKKLTDEITEAGYSADDFKDKVTEIGKSKVANFDEIVADYGSIEKAFKNGALSSNLLNEALKETVGSTEDISKKLNELRGEYKTNEDLLKALTKAGYKYSDMQNLVAKSEKGQTISLSDLTDAQLKSIGYTEAQIESIKLLAKQVDLAGGSVSGLIENISVPSGRELLIDSLRVSIRNLISVFETVGKAWREVFPPTTADQLYAITKRIQEFTLSLRPSEETLDKLQRTFRGLFSILKIGKQLLSAFFSGLSPMFDSIGDLSGGILGVTASFGDWIYELSQSIEKGKSFSFITDTITSVLDGSRKAIQFVIDGFGNFSGVFSTIGNTISSVVDKLLDILGKAFTWIRENISAGDIFAGLAGGGIFMLVKKLGSFVDKLKDIFSFGKDDDGSPFSDILESLHGSLESFQQGINVASLVGIAGAIMMLSSSLRKISEIEPAKIGYSLLTIAAMVKVLNSGFRSMLKSLSRFSAKGVIKASISMIAMAKAIDIMASAMQKIGELDLDEIGRGLAGIGGLLIELSVAIRLMSKGGVTLRTSIALIALAQACKMLGDAFSKFSSFSWDEIGRGLAAMGGALLEFTVVLGALSKVGGFGALLGGTAILIAAQSLDEISENLKRLGDLSWDQIGKGLSAMGGALLEFGVVLGALSKVGGFGSILGGTAILIAVQSLDEISENLKRLGDLAWDEIGRGLAAMGGALLELGAVIGLLGKLTGISSIFGATAILIAVQSLGDISENLARLGKLTWEEIGKGLSAMGGALLELGTILGLLGKLAGFSGILGAGAILIAIQGLDDLAGALEQFGAMSWSEIGKGLTAMGAAMAEVALITGVTGAVGGIAAAVGAGTILLAVQGLDDLANALKKFGSMSWDEIGRGLAAMGAAMGEVALGSLLNTLSGFGAGAISEVAVPLGDLADSVKKWGDVNVPENLGYQLALLASGVSAFNFSGWGADAIAAIAVPIGDMADSMKKWSGVSIPENLGTQIGSLASGVSAFNFSGWGADALSTAAPGIGDMADAISKWKNVSIPDGLEEGLTGIANGVNAFSFAFVGGWSMGSIKEPLDNLADSVKKWSGVTVPPNIYEDLKSLADGVASFSGAFIGGWALDDIGPALASFGENFLIYSNFMKEVDVNVVKSTTNAAQSLVELANTLPNNKLFTDETWLDEFGAQLSEFGGYFRDYYNNISGVNVSILSGVISQMYRLVDLAKGMSGLDTSGMSSFGKALKNLGNSSVDEFISAFTGSASRVSQAINGMLNSMLTAFQGRGYEFNSAGQTITSQFVAGVKIQESSVKGIFVTLVNTSLISIREKQKEFNQAGQLVMNQFIAGIKSGESKLRGVFDYPISSMLSSISSRRGDFINAGRNLVEGFAEGITANTFLAEARAAAMATSSYNAAMKAMDARSPSRLFTKAGGYVPAGFAKGIDSGEKEVVSSAKSMAQRALDTTKSAISKISDLLDSDLDLQPTIRPVLDLSSVQSGTRSLSTLFSQKQVASISTAMNRPSVKEIQNGSSDTESSGAVFNFTQNNYSPKALSRVDIYRQTKNQFSAMKGLVSKR